MPRGKRAESKTPTVDYAAGFLVISRCAQIEYHRYNEASMRLKGGIAAMALRQAEAR
jgi:hypothetical protein